MSRFRDFESKPQSLSNRQHHDSPIFDFDSSVKISDGLEVLLKLQLLGTTNSPRNSTTVGTSNKGQLISQEKGSNKGNLGILLFAFFTKSRK